MFSTFALKNKHMCCYTVTVHVITFMLIIDTQGLLHSEKRKGNTISSKENIKRTLNERSIDSRLRVDL
jgi:hypothetical protein